MERRKEQCTTDELGIRRREQRPRHNIILNTRGCNWIVAKHVLRCLSIHSPVIVPNKELQICVSMIADSRMAESLKISFRHANVVRIHTHDETIADGEWK